MLSWRVPHGQACNAAMVEADDDLMERDYGAYEGKRTVDIEVERPG